MQFLGVMQQELEHHRQLMELMQPPNLGQDGSTTPATLTTFADRQRLRPVSAEEECKEILYQMM